MCYQPLTIKTPQGYRTVPCGHCLECLRKYQSDWSNRMYEELKSHDGKAVFFTLTYDDNNVPKNYLYYDEQGDYEIFRSPSDYGYNNCFTDEKGRERVLPSCGRERKHKPVAPETPLREAVGEELKVIDFNVKRVEGEKFRDKIQKIYGDYLRNFVSAVADTGSRFLECDTDRTDFYDFEEYEGPDFVDQDEVINLYDDVVIDNFTELLNDDDYDESVIDRVENGFISSKVRQRPVMMFNSVRKQDVQDWLKRARRRRDYWHEKQGKPKQEFTYFITAEYGPRTLRPHYHGVIFGLTAQESMDMCNDWRKHHGERIQWENVDLSKGDMSYCAKYCSKGFFEHPLCSKDFFYFRNVDPNDPDARPFTEYHSKHYERCIEIFGVDAPIVDKPFHLISKGMGAQWIDDHKEEFLAPFKDIEAFMDEADASATTLEFTKEYAPWDSEFSTIDAPIDGAGFKTVVLIVNNEHKKTKDYEQEIENLFNNFHYYRTVKGKVVPYGVPKYYRAKILDEGLRPALTNFILSVNVGIYQEKFEQLRAQFPLGEDAEIVSLMEKQERREKNQRMRNAYEKLEKLYNKSKI